MIYNLSINQIGIYNNFPELGIEEYFLFSGLKKMLVSDNRLESVVFGETVWKWISHENIKDQLPLLKGSNRTIQRRISLLIEVGLIRRQIFNNKTYYALGERIGLLEFSGYEKSYIGFSDACKDLEFSELLNTFRGLQPQYFTIFMGLLADDKRPLEQWKNRVRGAIEEHKRHRNF